MRVCLEHYKGPVACRVQISLSRMRMPKRKTPLLFFLTSEFVRKKTNTHTHAQRDTVNWGLHGSVMVVGLHLNSTRFSRAASRATAGYQSAGSGTSSLGLSGIKYVLALLTSVAAAASPPSSPTTQAQWKIKRLSLFVFEPACQLLSKRWCLLCRAHKRFSLQ